MKSAIDNLKQKPKEQKTAVAGGVATAVVAILLIGWAFFYMRHVLSAKPGPMEFPEDEYDFSAFEQANIELSNSLDDFRNARSSGYGTGAPFGEAHDNMPLEY